MEDSRNNNLFENLISKLVGIKYNLILCGVMIILFSCKEDTFFDSTIRRRTNDPIIEMSYTIETIKYHRNFEAANKFDTIALTPDVDARNVS
jgi:hypothetical protein